MHTIALFGKAIGIPARGHSGFLPTPWAMTSSTAGVQAHPSIRHLVECRRPDGGGGGADDPPTVSGTNTNTTTTQSSCPTVFVDVDQCRIAFREPLDAPLSGAELVTLAIQCDDALYNNNTTATCSFVYPGSFLDHLRQLGETNEATLTAVTALVSFHRLEAAVRQRTGYRVGQAPLLTTMLHDLRHVGDTSNLACVLQGLLLPTGLNLRNLLWHGFAGGLPRPWLSLSLCLIRQLEHGTPGAVPPPHTERTTDKSGTRETPTSLPDRCSPCATVWPPSLCTTTATSTLTRPAVDDPVLLQWIPRSHHNLWRCAHAWQTDYPTWSLAVLCLVLEHGLRLQWCRVHQRPMDAVAQPQQLYVTLDGFGQRRVHELLLHPYRQDGRQRNQLVEQCLDASTTALLSDVFCAPWGPNLRARLAHGGWDTQLENEGIRLAQQIGNGGNGTRDRPWEQTLPTDKSPNPCLATVLVALQAAAYSCSGPAERAVVWHTLSEPYTPQYSYAASTRRNLQRCQTALLQLSKHVDHRSPNERPPTCVQRLAIVKQEDLVQLFSQRLDQWSFSNGTAPVMQWTTEQLYQDYDLNQQLAPLGAVQQLIQDIALALTELNQEITVAHSHGNNSQQRNLSTRQRRRHHRVRTTCASTGAIVYGFAAYIVLLALRDALDINQWSPPERVKLVERTRMVVSTVSTYLTKNTERAYKAIEDYTKGKVLQKLVLDQPHHPLP